MICLLQEEKEKKKQEVQEKKLASKQAYEEEMSSIKAAKPAPTKVTQAEIASNIQKTSKGIFQLLRFFVPENT